MSDEPVVVVGMGELGTQFASGFLKAGRTVVPVLRGTDQAALASELPEVALCLVAVGEGELDSVLEGLPAPWLSRVALLQNELVPASYRRFDLNPTIAVVWFEKKPGRLVKPILPSVLSGAGSEILAEALGKLSLDCEVVKGEAALVDAMVCKNAYILVTNIAGLHVGGNVQQLYDEHAALAERVLTDVLAVQSALVGRAVDGAMVRKFLERAVAADPEHGCRGRSAPMRLKRALDNARAHGVAVPTLSAMESA